MKRHRVLCICALLTVPQLALAKLPFTNDSFGKLEGTLSLCSKLNPEGAAKYRELGKVLVQGVPEKELAEARKTAEYKEAYESIGTELDKMPKDREIEACKASLKN